MDYAEKTIPELLKIHALMNRSYAGERELLIEYDKLNTNVPFAKIRDRLQALETRLLGVEDEMIRRGLLTEHTL